MTVKVKIMNTGRPPYILLVCEGARAGGRGGWRQGDGEGHLPRAADHPPQRAPQHHVSHQGEEAKELVQLYNYIQTWYFILFFSGPDISSYESRILSLLLSLVMSNIFPIFPTSTSFVSSCDCYNVITFVSLTVLWTNNLWIIILDYISLTCKSLFFC